MRNEQLVDIEVTPQSIREVENALKQMDYKAQKKYNIKALKSGARLIVTAARSYAPVDTGNLKRNIKVFNGKNRRDKRGFSVKIDFGKKAFYGQFVEFGTKKQDAQPHLEPAFEQKKDEAVEMVGARFWAFVVLDGFV